MQRGVRQGHRGTAEHRPRARGPAPAEVLVEESPNDRRAREGRVGGDVRGAVERVLGQLDAGVVPVEPGGGPHEGGESRPRAAARLLRVEDQHPRPCGEGQEVRSGEVQHVGGTSEVDGGVGEGGGGLARVLAELHSSPQAPLLVDLADAEAAGEVARAHREAGHLGVHHPFHRQDVVARRRVVLHLERLALVVEGEGVPVPPRPPLAWRAQRPRDGVDERPGAGPLAEVRAMEGGEEEELVRDPGLRVAPQRPGGVVDALACRPESGLREEARGV